MAKSYFTANGGSPHHKAQKVSGARRAPIRKGKPGRSVINTHSKLKLNSNIIGQNVAKAGGHRPAQPGRIKGVKTLPRSAPGVATSGHPIGGLRIGIGVAAVGAGAVGGRAAVRKVRAYRQQRRDSRGRYA